MVNKKSMINIAKGIKLSIKEDVFIDLKRLYVEINTYFVECSKIIKKGINKKSPAKS